MNRSMRAGSAVRRVVICGATGSIGRQACDIVARFPERFQLVGAVARRDHDGLAQIARQFSLEKTALLEVPTTGALAGLAIGPEAVCEVAAMEADVVVMAIPGAAALQPTLAAIAAGRDIAIATKEVLVMAGTLVKAAAQASGATLYPVDSEHSAIWQCLRGEDPASIARLILTGSGGPFRERPLDSFAAITTAEALQHPTWSMGPKVTIDSATMMNKGLEIIEAHFLFDVDYSAIDVVLHPSSIIHSMVEFRDGATMAQLGVPDMRVPISLAMTAGQRLPGVVNPVQPTDVSPLQFFPVDPQRFPAVALAKHAGTLGGAAPAVLNAANEVAVQAFLEGRTEFLNIVAIVAATVEAATGLPADSIAALIEADRWARRFALDAVGTTDKSSLTRSH